MKLTKVAHFCLAFLVFCVDALSQQTRLTWYAFDTDFISARYSDSSIGELPGKSARTAGNVHSEKCGGGDAELHISIRLDNVTLSAGLITPRVGHARNSE